MSDVPSWVLVFSTLTAAATGLAPQFIEPRKDREQRKAASAEARHVIKLEKLEKLFLVIDQNVTEMSSLLISEAHRLSSKQERFLLSPIVYGFLDKPQSIIATYFPEFAPIMDQARTLLRNTSSSWDQLVKTGDGSGEHAFQHTADILGIQSVALAKLRRALFDKAAVIAATEA